MNKIITLPVSQFFTMAKLPAVLLCLFLFNANNIEAQAKQCTAPNATLADSKLVDAGHVSFQHVIGDELNVISPPPAQGVEKKYFDNGYFRYELTGNAERDAETYKIEKEKLFYKNPELYKKWANEGAGSTIEKTALPKPQSTTKQ
ncbi:MAG: hypothetical protein NTY88_04920 [Bacteroidetes bacterium]|nr:hypothetical protein [Bacteroidota bacterium]